MIHWFLSPAALARPKKNGQKAGERYAVVSRHFCICVANWCAGSGLPEEMVFGYLRKAG